VKEGLFSELAGSVNLIVHTVLPMLTLFVIFVMILRAYLAQDRSLGPASSMGGSASSAAGGSADYARVFGEGVRTARALVIRPVQELLGAVDKFGGHPTGVRRVEWPHCGRCTEAMTFVGQLRVGKAKLIEYPTDGLLQIFVCSARAAGRDALPCDSSDPSRGAGRVRFQPLGHDDIVLGEDTWERDLLASAVKKNVSEPRGANSVKMGGLEKVGKEARRFYPYLARQYAVVSVELRPSVLLPPRPTAEQLALWSATVQELQVQVGGHPAWTRGEPKHACTCGARMEPLMQLDPFDEVLTVPVAARMTVLGCPKRCGPESFALMWQAP
jgi:hypothetical protein